LKKKRIIFIFLKGKKSSKLIVYLTMTTSHSPMHQKILMTFFTPSFLVSAQVKKTKHSKNLKKNML